jgi:protein-tyrosine kinase
MERIQQALARARAEREGGEGDAHPSATPVRPVTELNIRYSQTRRIECSPSVLRERRLLIGDEESVEGTAYKMLRTQVLQRMKANHWSTLGLVSPGLGEGRTLTAANLAISLARELSHSVLLVDLDMRRPALHRLFGVEAPEGLSDYLLDDVPLSRLLFNPGIERLIVLPGGKPATNSSELLASPKMAQLVDEIKKRYPSRIVLFDMPPLLERADTLAFSPYVDAVLLVIEEGKTARDDLVRTVELLAHTNVVGSVLNKSSERPAAARLTKS